MTKQLKGDELALFIKERQAKEVRRLKQAEGVNPRLAIVTTGGNPVIDTYIRLKQSYGEDIAVAVDVYELPQSEIDSKLRALNADPSVHGIILQLPLDDPSQTDQLSNLIAPEKDIDALGEQAKFDGATATAINYLLAGYNIELTGKNIVIIGRGKLVGAPLAKLWHASGYQVATIDETTPAEQRVELLQNADVIVTAVGQPNLLTSDQVPIGAIVIDAATTSENGRLVGDVADEVRSRSDVTITPIKGGVGPLTIAAVFDNLLRAARASKNT